MKELEAIIQLIVIILLFIPKTLVFMVSVIEGAIRITKNTIIYFIKQLESEIVHKKPLKPCQ